MVKYMLLARHCLLLTLLVISLYTDLARGRLYNFISLPALFVGLLLNYVLGGLWEGGASGANLGGSLLAVAVAGGIFLWPYLKGGIGAGDVKLICAVGAVGGFYNLYLLFALVYSAIIGALMAVLVLIWRRKLWEGLKGSVRFVFSLKRVDKGQDSSKEEAPGRITVPYGSAIAIGSTIAWFVVELSG